MAGLESIALAVDFLERSGMQEVESHSSASFAVQPTAVASPIPLKSSFLNVPRRVSSESVYEESARNISPVASSPSSAPPPEDLVLAETLSPEEITRMVENLSDDGEFKGPPPPPPAPTDVITRVLDFDVLCGRGGETNHHSGNVKYRTLVKHYQPLYIMSKRRDKPLIASKIVRLVRHMGGRFLRKDNSNTWRDVGNTKAREKTSQALREGAPDLRSPQKGEGKQGDDSVPSSNLGERQQPEFMGPPPPPYPPSAGMGVFAGPTIVESSTGDAGSPSAPKKLRLAPQPPMHGLQQFWGPAPHRHHHHQFMHSMGPPPPTAAPPFMGHHHHMHVVSPADMPLGRHNPPPMMSPHSFAATISADDDDSRSSEERQAAARPKPRGPRLKLLKRRLQEDEQKGN